MPENKVAAYKAAADGNGYRFLFYCQVSGAHVCTTKEVYPGDTPEAALLTAWEREGRRHFNQCRKCGRWMIDAVYNAEVLECVECAPYEAEPRFCKNCGVKVEEPATCCPSCGKKLRYEGGGDRDDPEGSV